MKLKLSTSVVNFHNELVTDLKSRGAKPTTLQKCLLMCEGRTMDKKEEYLVYDALFCPIYFSELAKQYSKLHELYSPSGERVADMAERAYMNTLIKLNQMAFTQTSFF